MPRTDLLLALSLFALAPSACSDDAPAPEAPSDASSSADAVEDALAEPDAAGDSTATTDTASSDTGTVTADGAFDSGTTADTGTSTDASLASDASADAGKDASADASKDAIGSDGAAGDAGSCVHTSTVGVGVAGLTVEACTFVGSVPGANSDLAVSSVAIAPGGAAVYVVHGFPVRISRYVDDAAPGCRLTLDTSFVSPLFPGTTPYAVDVAADGTFYASGSASGNGEVSFSGPKSGRCYGGVPLPQTGGLQVGDDGLVVSRDAFGQAKARATAPCAEASTLTFAPNPTRGATRLGGDFVFVANTALQRFSASGTSVWTGTGKLFIGNAIGPCGTGLCVAEGGSGKLARFSVTDGSRVSEYSLTELFGVGGGAFPMDATPTGTHLIAAHVETASAGCVPVGGSKAVGLVRISGF
jgi:hypothetical protein